LWATSIHAVLGDARLRETLPRLKPSNTMFLQKRASATPLPLPPRPLVLPPSGTYDGDDGKWSTFMINVAGDGAGRGQNFKVLISTSSPITMVPVQTEWCNTEECAERRGVIDGQSLGLVTTQSDMYSTPGQWDLPITDLFWWSRTLLSPSSNGSLNGWWGLTNVGLGEASPQSITMPDQYVAVNFFKDFFLGSLGLSIGPISPQGGATKLPFLNRLASAEDSPIASSSYGFTAGASYRKWFQHASAQFIGLDDGTYRS
jgi:hypothetical protein